MKGVYIKWRRCSPYEKRKQRQKAIKNAYKRVRQSCKKQIQNIINEFNLSDYEIIPNEWYDGNIDKTPIYYFDDFMHPYIRLGYFD